MRSFSPRHFRDTVVVYAPLGGTSMAGGAKNWSPTGTTYKADVAVLGGLQGALRTETQQRIGATDDYEVDFQSNPQIPGPDWKIVWINTTPNVAMLSTGKSWQAVSDPSGVGLLWRVGGRETV
jgi:hypothetical protein